MGVVNLKWRKALAVKGAWFEKSEEDVVWPEAMRLQTVAGLQCNGDIAYGKVLYNAMLAACNSDDLSHNVRSMNLRSGYKKVFIGHDLVQSFATGTKQVDRFRHDPVYTPKDFFYVKATDFAAWLAAQGEPPSEHIAAWFEAVGAGAAQVATVTNTKPQNTTAQGRKPKRRDLLAPLIQDAQNDCSDPEDAAAVFTLLRTWAQAKPVRAPLVGVTEDGRIQWRDSNDKPQELSSRALGQRLKRKQEASSKPTPTHQLKRVK